jgi:hypothetical protein
MNRYAKHKPPQVFETLGTFWESAHTYHEEKNIANNFENRSVS